MFSWRSVKIQSAIGEDARQWHLPPAPESARREIARISYRRCAPSHGD
jgi:hypothetical protein